MKPVTEGCNTITSSLDRLDVAGQLRALGECDEEMFAALRAPSSVGQLVRACQAVREARARGALLLLGGSGTSGRLAYIASQGGDARVRYLIAGGDGAIVRSKESSEDDVSQGVADLEAASQGAPSVLYVGISCGLSAPYVAAQLHHCLERAARFTPVLLGFNPVEAARSHVIAGADYSFRDVARRVQLRVNPVLGPEPIAGSSRMKGGSATKIILDVMLSDACTPEAVLAMLDSFHAAARAAVAHPRLPAMVEGASRALNAGAYVRYSSSTSRLLYAQLDASECPPTFGAAFEDVSVGPRVNDADYCIDVDGLELHQGPYGDLQLKLMLNCVSTLAHVARGKVLGNLMIDVHVSNQKLYARAIQIVSKVSGQDEGAAEAHLLRSIYSDTGVPKEARTPAQHVQAAFGKKRIVPVAILLAKGACATPAEAREKLHLHPKVSDALCAIHLTPGCVVEFESAEVGRARFLNEQDDYVAALTPFDRQCRAQSASPVSCAEFCAFQARSVLDWTPEQRTYLTRVFKRIAQCLVERDLTPHLRLPATLYVVATDGSEEANAAYCRGRDTIVLPVSHVNWYNMDKALELATHELGHIVSRWMSQEQRDAYYAVFGYKPLPLGPLRVAQQTLCNPDAIEMSHYVEVDGQALVQVLLSTTDTYEPDMGTFFSLLTVNYAVVDLEDNSVSAIIPAAQVHPAFWEKVGRNTTYTHHVEETATDNFKVLVLQLPASTPSKIEGIKKVFQGVC